MRQTTTAFPSHIIIIILPVRGIVEQYVQIVSADIAEIVSMGLAEAARERRSIPSPVSTEAPTNFRQNKRLERLIRLSENWRKSEGR